MAVDNARMKISGVLQLTNRTLYGMTARHVPMYLFTPLNRDFPPMTVASSERDKTRNKLAVVEPIEDHENEGRSLKRGALCAIIGNCGDPVAERKAIHLAYSPVSWKAFPMINEPADHDIVLDVPHHRQHRPERRAACKNCGAMCASHGILRQNSTSGHALLQ